MAGGKGKGGFGTVYIASSLINAYTSYKVSAENRNFQEKQAEENRKLNMAVEQNRQNFQLEMNERNAQMQKRLSQQNHEFRLLEMQNNFEKVCMQAEWNQFLKNWPLITPPSVVRAEQLLPDNTVSMRVIFSKCNDEVFGKYVYPRVEQELREFVDIYTNEFGSKNIMFYHNAFFGNHFGGAVDSNIHYALRELPVLILESNVLFDQVCVSCTIWGLGSEEKKHTTIFKIPYKKAVANGGIALSYYAEITRKIVAHLKFVTGYAYDVYNLVQYDRAPLLPKVAKFELEQNAFGCLLEDQEVAGLIGEQYGEVYEMAIGSQEDGQDKAWSEAVTAYKKSILHQIRLDYADEVREFVPGEEYRKYLDDSISAWCDLRTERGTEEFLKDLANRSLSVNAYFSKEDVSYFEKLNGAYALVAEPTPLGELVKAVTEILKNYEPAAMPAKNSQALIAAKSGAEREGRTSKRKYRL